MSKKEKTLQEIKEKYEGKYWKYVDIYGKLNEIGFLYSFCINVENQNKGLFNTFQTTPFGKSRFAIKECKSFHICQTEITKEEYMEALNKFKGQLNNLGEI
jgi:hypothetical protein